MKYWFMSYTVQTRGGTRLFLSRVTTQHPMVKIHSLNRDSRDNYTLQWWKELALEEAELIVAQTKEPITDWESAG